MNITYKITKFSNWFSQACHQCNRKLKGEETSCSKCSTAATNEKRNLYFHVCIFDDKKKFTILKGFGNNIPEDAKNYTEVSKSFTTNNDEEILVALNQAYMESKVQISFVNQTDFGTGEVVKLIHIMKFMEDKKAMVIIKAHSFFNIFLIFTYIFSLFISSNFKFYFNSNLA